MMSATEEELKTTILKLDSLEVGHTGPSITDILPPELISYILWLSIPPFQPLGFSAKDALEVLRLGALSRTIRDLVYSTPKLWATVTFFVRYDDYELNGFNYIPQWLSRTGIAPLQIRIKIRDYDVWLDDDAILDLMNLLRPYLHRCTHLDLYFPFPRLNILPESPGALPVLQSLLLFLSRSSFQAETFVLNMPTSVAPQLQEVAFFGLWLERMNIPWQNLQTLHLDRVFPGECLFALRNAPNITHLTLFEILKGFSEDTIDPDPKSTPPLVLPHLKSIDWFTDVTSLVVPLFKLIVAPVLTTIRVSEDSGYFEVDSFLYLIRSCRDTLTTILMMGFDSERALSLWSRVPCATVVVISDWNTQTKAARPMLTDDILSLYDTPSSREWPRVRIFLPAIPYLGY